MFSGPQFGTLIMFSTGGLLANNVGGWPSIFYISGVAALVCVLFCYLLVSNNPVEHSSISDTERLYIMDSLSNTTSSKVNKLNSNKNK